MKDKILYLILGFLIGAIITAGGFLLFSKNSKGPMGEGRPNREARGNMIQDDEFKRNAR